MSESTLYVTYYVTPQQRSGFRRMEGIGGGNTPNLFPLTEGNADALEQAEQRAVQEFLNGRNPKGTVIESFTEVSESKRTAKWPQLQKALESCKRNGATLLIAELGTLASNESFAQCLLSASVPFHCLDQPFVTQAILEGLSKYAKVQRELHGKLIREGLKLTNAKSGNPNAAKVIGKVNKPKIDTAIVFAFLLHLIIQNYRRKGYSQRQMVKTLNEEGFTAPEGGKWVLSQLQKVLDRVRLNEIATELKPLLVARMHASTAQIAEDLNAKAIAPLKPPVWDENQVKKLQDRIDQIEDIVLINRFVLDLLPLLHDYRRRNLPATEMLKALQQGGIKIRQNQEEVIGSHPDKDPKGMHERLKQTLQLFKTDGSLDLAFESASKHLSVYLKIVKSHIEQLAKVLKLETHNNRTLENVELAEPVRQLMQLFRELQEEDIHLLETLALEARNWPSTQNAHELAKKPATVTET